MEQCGKCQSCTHTQRYIGKTAGSKAQSCVQNKAVYPDCGAVLSTRLSVYGATLHTFLPFSEISPVIPEALFRGRQLLPLTPMRMPSPSTLPLENKCVIFPSCRSSFTKSPNCSSTSMLNHSLLLPWVPRSIKKTYSEK